jgi:hypothetical protein
LDLPLSDEPIDPNAQYIRPAKAFAAVKAMTKIPDPSAPRSWTEAMKSPEASQWLKAAQEEIMLLKSKNCYTLVRKSDTNRRPTPGQWIFKKKVLEDGNFRYKARWVIRGNQLSESHWEAHNDTYAPVVSAPTSRILFITYSTQSLARLTSGRRLSISQWKAARHGVHATANRF